MLLALDVGNTNITVGIFEGAELRCQLRLHTDARLTSDELGVLLTEALQGRGFNAKAIDGVVISSVVPPLDLALVEMSTTYFGITPLVIGIETLGKKIYYDDPTQVGADRIANAIGVYATYGGPAVMVDFGTATTIDAIDADGAYLGGAIAPGLQLSLDALVTKAARLSRVDLAPPSSVIGHTTKVSMQSGIVYGYVGLVESIVTRMKAEVGGNPKVIAIGGLATLISDLTPVIDVVDQLVTLTGLRLAFAMNRE